MKPHEQIGSWGSSYASETRCSTDSHILATQQLLLRLELPLCRQIIHLRLFDKVRKVMRINPDDSPEPMAWDASPRDPVIHRALRDPDASCGVRSLEQSSWFLLRHIWVSRSKLCQLATDPDMGRIGPFCPCSPRMIFSAV